MEAVNPKQEDRSYSIQLAWFHLVFLCPPPLLGHHPMVTSLLDQIIVIIELMKDGDGERTFKLGPIVTMSFHPWDSNSKFSPLRIEQNQPNPLQQDSPIASFPHEQTLQQPTPGPSGTQWLEDLLCEPSQTNEPPIPGPSPSSKSHEDVLTCEPEPEVAATHSMEEPFGKPQLHFFYSSQLFLTFPLTISSPSHSIIIINNMPVGSLPVPSSPHSHNEACQEFTNLRPTLMIP
ncbi:hypothetical protein O181_057193 [Austropuccinia psidii MF-1]|uniref:Uncharacterized protein n=1 Tax=Austropuccinia psidii MF-1 TaxID=1389203 RepID=A0A9Q3HU86_9BASI|nr:hypothetical protein [Austropuccinia psidii MF-1]